MLADLHFKAWQVDRLSDIASIGLTKEEAQDVVDLMYNNDETDPLRPYIHPQWVNFRSKDFKHIAADIFTLNMTPAAIKYPQIADNMLDLAAMLMNSTSYAVITKDKEDKALQAMEDNALHLSLFGFHASNAFAATKNLTLLTDKSIDEVEYALGASFSGNLSTDISLISKDSLANKLYIDANFLMRNWADIYANELMPATANSVANEISKKTDSKGLPLFIYKDTDCISKVCVY